MEISEGQVWPAAGGVRIPVAELSNAHLINIVSMLLRQARQRMDKELSDLQCGGYYPQGEMAQLAVQSSEIELEEGDPRDYVEHPAWEALCEQIVIRDLAGSMYTDDQLDESGWMPFGQPAKAHKQRRQAMETKVHMSGGVLGHPAEVEVRIGTPCFLRVCVDELDIDVEMRMGRTNLELFAAAVQAACQRLREIVESSAR